MSAPIKSKPGLPAFLENQLRALKAAGRAQRHRETELKNRALRQLAQALEQSTESILRANALDLERLPANATSAFRDRLTLNEARLKAMAVSLRQVADLPDPVAEILDQRVLANGLQVRRERAPLGLLFMIFEARPNVILEAFSLAFKSGNVILLRGGSESRETCHQIYQMMGQVLAATPLAEVPFVGLEDYDRGLVETLLQRHDWIDVVIPRGGDKLIEFVQTTATMPIIKNDRGLCHAYVDHEADLNMAVQIVFNAKTQRPGVCNSVETVLVHENVAKIFLPMLFSALNGVGVQWRADEPSLKILGAHPRIQAATDASWDTEYLDLILNCRIVKNLDQALEHIEKHGSRHSEVIVTRDATAARRFEAEVDAAAVYWNASTRFTDGFELGLGGELGISTQKLHVRGPVGLRELTVPRWIIEGTGQIRDY